MKPLKYIAIASINTGETSAKCAMCGNEAIISDEHDSDKNEQQELNSHIILEQINGTCYTFDTTDCAIMFKRFSSVYGSNFADE
jgi:hypothetical protein